MTLRQVVISIVLVIAALCSALAFNYPSDNAFRAAMPIIGFLVTGLIVGAVFVFVRPRIEQAAVGAIPQLQSNRVVNLIFVGTLALISIGLAGALLRAFGVGGRR